MKRIMRSLRERKSDRSERGIKDIVHNLRWGCWSRRRIETWRPAIKCQWCQCWRGAPWKGSWITKGGSGIRKASCTLHTKSIRGDGNEIWQTTTSTKKTSLFLIERCEKLISSLPVNQSGQFNFEIQMSLRNTKSRRWLYLVLR